MELLLNYFQSSSPNVNTQQPAILQLSPTRLHCFRHSEPRQVPQACFLTLVASRSVDTHFVADLSLGRLHCLLAAKSLNSLCKLLTAAKNYGFAARPLLNKLCLFTSLCYTRLRRCLPHSINSTAVTLIITTYRCVEHQLLRKSPKSNTDNLLLLHLADFLLRFLQSSSFWLLNNVRVRFRGTG